MVSKTMFWESSLFSSSGSWVSQVTTSWYTCPNPWLIAGDETKIVGGLSQVPTLFGPAFCSIARWVQKTRLSLVWSHRLCSLMTRTAMVLKILVYLSFNHLTWLLAKKNSIGFSCRESIKFSESAAASVIRFKGMAGFYWAGHVTRR